MSPFNEETSPLLKESPAHHRATNRKPINAEPVMPPSTRALDGPTRHSLTTLSAFPSPAAGSPSPSEQAPGMGIPQLTWPLPIHPGNRSDAAPSQPTNRSPPPRVVPACSAPASNFEVGSNATPPTPRAHTICTWRFPMPTSSRLVPSSLSRYGAHHVTWMMPLMQEGGARFLFLPIAV
jgi:hypothetical protein